MGPKVRVFVVEDSSLIRKRIIENVKGLGNFDVVGFAESEQEAVDANHEAILKAYVDRQYDRAVTRAPVIDPPELLDDDPKDQKQN